ncbi:uroporphyrinogen-III methyltransferase [alpha proteobacterium U9-1i]|nr:uroporphyrinogen-III methyltransferase [alpha proteobacterium U9-1i]
MTGVVYLVGAGPGAADLLTLRAARLLAQADLVLHDALVEPDVLALAPQARKLNVGKRANRPSTDQTFINRVLVRAARARKVIVRLKGGDPMLFGRAQEEIDACRKAGVPVEIVPGISAAFAAAAEAGASLTQRRVARSVAFVTPSVSKGDSESAEWADAAAAAESVALYMGATHAERVRDALLARGVAASTPLLLVESAGRPETRRTAGVLGALVELAAQTGAGPVLLLLGNAFAKADAEIAPEWFEARA